MPVNPALHRLALVAAVVALAVIVLGAYVRLSHAGLGCPDWPGCYGQLTWPVEAHEITRAEQAFPARPVETHKAWKEMVHRYLAGLLVLLVVAINFVAWRGAHSGLAHRMARLRGLAALLLVLILFQAALGMWTVTLKLKPVVVMGHLLGGWRLRPAAVAELAQRAPGGGRPAATDHSSHADPRWPGGSDPAIGAGRLDQRELCRAGLPGLPHLPGTVVARDELRRGLRAVA
jgi:heme A synthase